MKKCILLFCIQLFVLNILSQERRKASIYADLDQEEQKISPLIYGQFIEFLGRCIDGGIYQEGSPLSNDKGFRKDVLKSVQELHTPILRFPGGTVVKIYHWKDGIGNKADRPKRKNLIWGGIIDNHFGTAEFVEYCRETGAEPFLVVNMSTETPFEASEWVEYCNGTEDTYWANLRRSHGYEKPFNVKYWGIGNEEYAIPDAGKNQDVQKYIDDSWQFIKLMKLQDPAIKITLVGNSENLDWSRKVVAEMHQVCDFLAVHFYSMPEDSKYSTLFKSVDKFNIDLDSMRTIVRSCPVNVKDFPMWYRFPPRQEPLKLAIDEWGIWDINSDKGRGTYNMEYPYNWAQALAVGKFLNIFQRNADITGLATWAQTVNVLAPIMTTREGSYRQTIYTPLQAYRQFTEKNNLPVQVDSPGSEENIKLIDATASISDNKKQVVVSILNLSEKEQVRTNISFIRSDHKIALTLQDQITYTAPSMDAVNTLGNNVVRQSRSNKIIKSGEGFEIAVEPASINFLVFTMSD